MKVQTFFLLTGFLTIYSPHAFAELDDTYDIETQEKLNDVEDKELARFKATHEGIRIGELTIEDSSTVEGLEELVSDT